MLDKLGFRQTMRIWRLVIRIFPKDRIEHKSHKLTNQVNSQARFNFTVIIFTVASTIKLFDPKWASIIKPPKSSVPCFGGCSQTAGFSIAGGTMSERPLTKVVPAEVLVHWLRAGRGGAALVSDVTQGGARFDPHSRGQEAFQSNVTGIAINSTTFCVTFPNLNTSYHTVRLKLCWIAQWL